jgi:hypothetical protein
MCRFRLASCSTGARPWRRTIEEARMAAPGFVTPGKGTEGRLDPIRWRRPERGSLIRLAAVAALLATAALIAWSGPTTCAAPTATPGVPPAPGPSAGATASVRPAAEDPARGRPAVPRGSIGVPVRLAEPTALTLVRPGDRVDLLRIGPGSDTTAVAAAALVLGVTGADDPTAGGLLLALRPDEAKRAVAGADRAGFAIFIRPD